MLVRLKGTDRVMIAYRAMEDLWCHTGHVILQGEYYTRHQAVGGIVYVECTACCPFKALEKPETAPQVPAACMGVPPYKKIQLERLAS